MAFDAGKNYIQILNKIMIVKVVMIINELIIYCKHIYPLKST